MTSGANAICEVYSTGALLIHNGEDNSFSDFCDALEDWVAPLDASFALLGAGVSGYKLIKNEEKVRGLFNRIYNEDGVGIICTGAGYITDYALEGKILGTKLEKTEKGYEWHFMDTVLGNDPAAKEAAKTVLENGGASPEDAKAAVEKGVKYREGKTELPEVKVTDTIPVDKIPNITKDIDKKSLEEENKRLKDLLDDMDKALADAGVENDSHDEDGDDTSTDEGSRRKKDNKEKSDAESTEVYDEDSDEEDYDEDSDYEEPSEEEPAGTLDPVSKSVTALSNYTTIQLKMNGDHISASIDIDARNGNNSSVCHLKGDKD